MTSGQTDKLVEVDDEAHAMLKRYCEERGFDMKAFLSGVVVNAVKTAMARKRMEAAQK